MTLLKPISSMGAGASGRAWPPEPPGQSGEIEVDLARGCVTIGGRMVNLRPTTQCGVYWLDDGAAVRLAGFTERSRCVASALAADDPPARLLQDLRALLLTGSPSALHDAVMLALAGAGADAPSFSACAVAADLTGEFERPAIEVDRAAIGLAGAGAAPGGSWKRLVFVPPQPASPEALIDEMLRRLLERGRGQAELPTADAELTPDELGGAAEGAAWPTATGGTLSTLSNPPPVTPSKALPRGELRAAHAAAGTSVTAAQAVAPLSPHVPAAAAERSRGAAPDQASALPAAKRSSLANAATAKLGPTPTSHPASLDVPSVTQARAAAVLPSQRARARWQVQGIALPDAAAHSDAAAGSVAGTESEASTPSWPDPWNTGPAPSPAATAARPDSQTQQQARATPEPPDALSRIAWALADECDLRGIAP